MMTTVNKLNTVLDPFFIAWGDKVITWFEKAKEAYRAEYRAYWTKHAGEGQSSMRPTKESDADYEALVKKWKAAVGRGWFQSLQYDKVESVAKQVRKEMESKKIALVKKVEAKVGLIIEVNLHVGEDGSPNGLVVGDKGKVRVETISAGGWNIQCFHYRVLVK